MSTPLNFFYSYCHEDKEQRANLDKHLSLLVKNKVISEWYDGDITAGSDWYGEVITALEKADIVVFLVTSNWLSSDACQEEWTLAKKYSQKQSKCLIPIIATECAWLDFDDMSKKLVLPEDGKSVSRWDNADSAWLNVYTGIKKAAEKKKKLLN